MTRFPSELPRLARARSSLEVLALDPGFEYTGLAVLHDGRLTHFQAVSFKSPGQMNPDELACWRAERLWQLLVTLAGREASHFEFIALERTDWHQDLEGRASARWKQAYHRERETQAMMAWFIGAVAMACIAHNLDLVDPAGRWQFLTKGVNSWHRALGPQKKDAIKEYIAELFPQQFTYDRPLAALKHGQRAVSDHVSDAIGLGVVISDELRVALRSQGVT